MEVRRRIHSTQLPRIQRMLRLNTYEQRGTLEKCRRQLSFHINYFDILCRRSTQFVVYLKEGKFEYLTQLFYIPEEPLLEEFQKNICLEFLATIVCYLIAHDITISMLQGSKVRYLKTTLMHHQFWMKLLKQPISQQLGLQAKNLYSTLVVSTQAIIKNHVDGSYLRDILIESLKYTNMQCCSQLICTKILPILRSYLSIDFFLPSSESAYTLILDMDETILYYDQDSVRLRPFILTFLKQMSRIFDITLFTAGLESYAKRLLNPLLITKYFKYFLYRQHTITCDEYYAKDLRRLGRPLSKTIIIDNTPQCFSLQPDNGIQIQTWRGDTKDTALASLIPILKTIRFNAQDVRFQMRQYKNYNGLIFPK